MPDEALLPPIEIPWKLASTTQPLETGGPAETTVSLFFHEPDEEVLTSSSPDEKLVYLKVTASVSPLSLASAIDSELVAAFLAGNLPVLHVQLDLEVSPTTEETGGIRPYFHAARPLHRRIVETGIVGHDLVEGASDAQFFGKSGSHLYESIDSEARTTTTGGGASFTFPPFTVGGSAQVSRTDVDSQRTVDQVVDTTTRQAAEERRELVSHVTHVENVLTLLSGKYVGTPYLRFSLFPRPLQLLSIDPVDPNLWFGQLVRQRSSGIEGIQEFTAAVVVPRDTDFCVRAKLRRVGLLDDPPGPFSLDEKLRSPDLVQLARMVRYLYGLFPIGTPLEELDIDLVGQLTPGKDFRRPVVRLWAFRLGTQVVEALVVSPADIGGLVRAANVNYKHMLEVWLETLRAEHERELARSPLERGATLGEDRRLDTCFAVGEEGSLQVASSSRSVSPLVPVDVPVAVDPGVDDRIAAAAGVRARAMRTITRWTALEQQLNTFLSNLDELPQGASALGHPRVVGVLAARWAKMASDDPRNLDLDRAAKALGLTHDLKSVLEQAGVRDLRGLARSLVAVPEIQAQNDEMERIDKEVAADECDPSARRLLTIVAPEPFELAPSASHVEAIRDAIAGTLDGTYGDGPGGYDANARQAE